MALASTTETNTDLPPVHLAANGHTALFISHKLRADLPARLHRSLWADEKDRVRSAP
jgi:hypothetical protein